MTAICISGVESLGSGIMEQVFCVPVVTVHALVSHLAKPVA
jgi:hypothetical protein